MLHLIPDDDGLPHAPTSECGCDPMLALIRGQQVLMHFRPQPEVTCSFDFYDSFDDSTSTVERIHTALVERAVVRGQFL